MSQKIYVGKMVWYNYDNITKLPAIILTIRSFDPDNSMETSVLDLNITGQVNDVYYNKIKYSISYGPNTPNKWELAPIENNVSLIEDIDGGEF
jgi:hypothetical protein